MISTTELVEFSKLPVLFRHYQEHKAWNKKITFFEFMVEHYAESIADNPDYDLDKKLPFKSHVDHSFAFSLAAPPVPPFHYSFSPRLVPVVEKQSFAFSQHETFCTFLATIWQPPKLC